MDKTHTNIWAAVAFLTLLGASNADADTQIGLSVLYPPGDVNVTRHEWFNVSLNASCISGNCGKANISLYYIGLEIEEMWNVIYDGGSLDWARDVAVDSHDNVVVTGKSYLGGILDYFT